MELVPHHRGGGRTGEVRRESLPGRPAVRLRRARRATTAAAITLAGGLTFLFLPSASGTSPSATPVHAEYVLNGSTVGAGTVLSYGGQVYVPLGAVKELTGTELGWDAATATLSSGSATAGTSTYLEDLADQPYYKNSGALCWEYSTDATPGKMQSRISDASIWYPCKLVLPTSPTMGDQHYIHDIAVLVSATGSKTASSSNSVTLNYDLAGHYAELSGTIGLVDSPLNRLPMQVRFLGDGRALGTVALAPGSLPRQFEIGVAHVEELSVVVSNVSGVAPRWDSVYPDELQYSPGAVLLANPRLST